MTQIGGCAKQAEEPVRKQPVCPRKLILTPCVVRLPPAPLAGLEPVSSSTARCL